MLRRLVQREWTSDKVRSLHRQRSVNVVNAAAGAECGLQGWDSRTSCSSQRASPHERGHMRRRNASRACVCYQSNPGTNRGHVMEQIYNIGRVGRRVEYWLYAGGLSGG